MRTEGRKRVWTRVFGMRWFSGFATALVLVGSLAAAGLVFGGPAPSEAATAGPLMEIRMAIVDNPADRHREWIRVDSVQWGMARYFPGPPSPRANVTVSDVAVTKTLDKASPSLSKACADGKSLAKVEIQFCTGACKDKQKYLEYTLTNVIVTSYSISGTSQDDTVPVEQVTMNYAEIEWTYSSLDPSTEDRSQGLVCPDWGRECVPK